MVQKPEFIEKRIGHLTEVVHLAAKYLINEKKQAHEGEVFGYVAHMVLDCYNDSLFQLYKNDKELLAKDMAKSMKILEEHKIIGRNPQSNSYLIPTSGDKIHSLVTYDSVYGGLVNMTDMSFGIKL